MLLNRSCLKNIKLKKKKNFTVSFIEVPSLYLLRKIIIADGDLHGRWNTIRKNCHFMTKKWSRLPSKIQIDLNLLGDKRIPKI